MLKVSEVQIEAMRSVLVEAFEERLFDFARHDLEAVTSALDDDALRARLREDVEAAHAYGITSNRGVMRFVGFSLAGGERKFYRKPEFQAILTSADPEHELEYFLRRLQNFYEQTGAI